MSVQAPADAPVVAITRAADDAGTLAEAFSAQGLRTWHVPTIEFSGPPDPGPLRDCVNRLDEFQWLVFTSARAVTSVCGGEDWSQRWARSRERLRVASVGPATTARLARAGIDVHAVADEHHAAGLVPAMLRMTETLHGSSVLWPRANLARVGLVSTLESHGARVTAPVAYCTSPAPVAALAPLLEAVNTGLVRVITFLSPSSAASLARACAGRTLRELNGRVVVAAIGETTAAALTSLGAPPDVVGEMPSPECLASAVARFLDNPVGGRS